MKSKKSRKPPYYTAKETAVQIAAMMHRGHHSEALLPKRLFMDIASNPGGSHRERLHPGFLHDVRDWLVAYKFYSIVLKGDDLFIISADDVQRPTLLEKKLLTRAEWKGDIHWGSLEIEAEDSNMGQPVGDGVRLSGRKSRPK